MALTVLVVEDDWTVRSATDGPSALASVQEHPRDVVLSDVRVPAASALPPTRR